MEIIYFSRDIIKNDDRMVYKYRYEYVISYLVYSGNYIIKNY